MSDTDTQGVPARELSDEELEQQGTHAHETRNWVFLHGTAAQFAHHTLRMLELEQEYLHRHPKRTWQGSGGASTEPLLAIEHWRQTISAVIRQLEGLIALPDPQPRSTPESAAPASTRFLSGLAAASEGRLHKLEAHQLAREVGLERVDLANLYKADPALVVTEGEHRVITDAGRSQCRDAVG